MPVVNQENSCEILANEQYPVLFAYHQTFPPGSLHRVLPSGCPI